MNERTRASFRYLDLITALFVTVLLISNVASSKILQLGPFTFDGGTILFPVSYIFGDVLTEVYGYRRSRRVIWIGFGCAALLVLVLSLVGALPPAPGWEHQEAYEAILGATPRIVLGSLIAYFAGEFSNSYVLARMKVWSEGRWLWMRTIGSTVVGQAVDTALFVTIAFAGTLPWPLFWSIILSNYVFKVGLEAAMTPVTYRVTGFLKRAENEDVYDVETDFNPFRVRLMDRAKEEGR
ncbi:MAG TPA: queuosine precursor transporter [Anaerolineae bacterium]|nr:queuosine precursor transporter [Anaerolineae bacterium]